jgi:Csp protease B prodomain
MNLNSKNVSWESKIDHRLRAMIERTPIDSNKSNITINVLIKFSGESGPLEHHGIKTRAISGDIATAQIAVQNIKRVASMPEVLFMELSHALGPDISSNKSSKATDVLE